MVLGEGAAVELRCGRGAGHQRASPALPAPHHFVCASIRNAATCGRSAGLGHAGPAHDLHRTAAFGRGEDDPCPPDMLLGTVPIRPPHHRRLAKDYDRRVQTSETLIYIAAIRLMLNRIAPA